MPRLTSLTVVVLVTLASFAVAFDSHEWLSGIRWEEPVKVTPGTDNGPPSDAIVLFDGSDMSQWDGGENWIVEDGCATAHANSITTKQGFGDCQLHLEFATPETVEGTGQGRGNSGILFQERYEVQVLDSYGNETYFDGQCGAIYKQQPPMVNASRGPGEWQTYDIIFEAPRFHENGSLKSRGTLTVLHNGVVVQNHWELLGPTLYTVPPTYYDHDVRQPLQIQFHGNPVKFRNIWIRDLLAEGEA